MRKRMIIAIVALVVVFGGIFAYKAVGNYFMGQYFANMPVPTVTVSTAQVKQQSWQPRLTAVGQLSAVRGVEVSNQVSGVVREILFESGQPVEQGDLLVQLDDSAEQAELPGLQAAMELARLNLERAEELVERKLTSRENIDTLQSQLQQAQSAFESLKATIAKKAIRAPFTGTLGIRQVDLGQYLPAGTEIVTLQALEQLHADFAFPEEFLNQLAPAQPVRVTVSTYPDRVFTGHVNAVSVKVDPSSHNFAVQAVLDNPERLLLPGMFADVTVLAGDPQSVVTVPRTAISYSLHGDGVFVVEQKGKTEKGEPKLVASQRFVRVGESRGGMVRVLEGLEPGEVVVAAGALKLYDGAQVNINNEVALTGMDHEAPDFAAREK